MELIETFDLPENPDTSKVYRLLPKNPDPAYYWERVDRNIGWITKEEQEMLRKSVIGVAGCGGIGGQLAEKFLRLGIGEIRIADIEKFDASNINRQFGATRRNIGVLKAFATARMLREVSDDTTITVYPQGITEETVNGFVKGCDVAADTIEFWAVGARILLHQRSRNLGVSLFNAPTIGFGTRLYLFTPQSSTMEECLGLSYEEARALEIAVRQKKADEKTVKKIMDGVIKGLVPEVPEYYDGNGEFVRERLFKEGKAPIIATNPPFAAGFFAGRMLFYLLQKKSPLKRDIVETPEMPSYLYFDVATMTAKIVKGKWW